MAKTISNIVTSVRYDLRDTGSTQYTDAELLDYANRAIEALDATLSKINSDWVRQEDTTTALASAADSVTQSTRCIKNRQIFYGTTEIYEKSLGFIHDRRIHLNSATGLPKYWAEGGANVEFDYTADQEYALKIYYDQYSAELTINGVGGETSTSNMPHGDQFNQPIREAIVIMARNRQNYVVTGSAYLEKFFLSAAMSKVIGRNHVPKRRILDF